MAKLNMAAASIYDVVVIGYGNDLRGDDGLGPRVAAEIGCGAWPNVRAVAVHQLTPELVDILAQVQLAFFVDACARQDANPIEVHRIEPGNLALMTHAGDPRALLNLTQTLYGQAPNAWWVTIAGNNFDLGEKLSQVGEQHAKMAVDQIEHLLRGFSAKNRPSPELFTRTC